VRQPDLPVDDESDECEYRKLQRREEDRRMDIRMTYFSVRSIRASPKPVSNRILDDQHVLKGVVCSIARDHTAR